LSYPAFFLKIINKRILIQNNRFLIVVKDKCPVCKGNGTIELLGSQCPFCNGTGDFTKAAESYLDSHICQCIFLDRKKCPLCGKKCHHDTPNKPKVLIGPI